MFLKKKIASQTRFVQKKRHPKDSSRIGQPTNTETRDRTQTELLVPVLCPLSLWGWCDRCRCRCRCRATEDRVRRWSKKEGPFDVCACVFVLCSRFLSSSLLSIFFGRLSHLCVVHTSSSIEPTLGCSLSLSLHVAPSLASHVRSLVIIQPSESNRTHPSQIPSWILRCIIILTIKDSLASFLLFLIPPTCWRGVRTSQQNAHGHIVDFRVSLSLVLFTLRDEKACKRQRGFMMAPIGKSKSAGEQEHMPAHFG